MSVNLCNSLTVHATYSVCFTNFTLLNLPTVVQFYAQIKFHYCTSCLKKWSLFQKWSKLTQKQSSCYLDLNPWNCTSCLKKWRLLQKWSKLTQKQSSWFLDLDPWNSEFTELRLLTRLTEEGDWWKKEHKHLIFIRVWPPF